MEQRATVKRLLPDGQAELHILRHSACAGDCDSCGGCGSAEQSFLVIADNPIGAEVGDVVCMESESSPVLKAAALVYLIPLVGFLGGFLWGNMVGRWAVLLGLAGFVLGIIPAFIYNHHLKRKPVKHRIKCFEN